MNISSMSTLRIIIAVTTMIAAILGVGFLIWMLWWTFTYEGSLKGVGYFIAAAFFLLLVMPLGIAAALATNSPGISALLHFWSAVWFAIILMNQVTVWDPLRIVLTGLGVVYLMAAGGMLIGTARSADAQQPSE